MSRNFPNMDWLEWWHLIILIVIVYIWNLLYSRLGWNTELLDEITLEKINDAENEIRNNPSESLQIIKKIRDEDDNYKWSIVNNEDKKDFQFLTDEILTRIVISFAEKKTIHQC